jgi:DNA-binding FadR family transcriptional regulator
MPSLPLLQMLRQLILPASAKHMKTQRVRPILAVLKKLEAEFHVRIFAATRNELLLNLHDILRVIRNQPAWIEMKRRRYTKARRRGYCEDNEAIMQALFARNSDLASKTMKRHSVNMHQNLFCEIYAQSLAWLIFKSCGEIHNIPQKMH